MTAQLSDLLARVKAATGPDRAIDAAIACAFMFPGRRPAQPDDFEGRFGHSPGDIKVEHGFLMARAYTRSTDELEELIEHQLPGAWWLFAKGRTQAREPLFGVRLLFGSDEILGEGEHDSNLALAGLDALLKTLIARGRP